MNASPKTKAALLVSVSLNLAFVGAAAAFAIKEKTNERDYFFDRFALRENISPDVRAAFKDATESIRNAVPETRKNVRQEREKAIDALTSDPVDVPAFRAHSDAAAKERDAMKNAFRVAVEKLAASLSPEKRKELGVLLRGMRYEKRCGKD